MTDAPIGVFDSGVGGLTVARAIIDQLPRESILYVGDTAHSPYGPKPIAQVREYALAVLDDLVDQGVKLLVIACNTASSAMLRDARERYTEGRGIPVVEVIHPAVRAAVRQTRAKRIGVIGTVGTINSRAYDDAFIAASDLEIFSQACPRFVEFVESGITSGPELFAAAEEYLEPLKAARIDTLVLGCTHYPLLAGAIQYVMGEDVTLVSSAEETAYDVYRMLVRHGLERTSAAPPSYRFEATGDSKEEFLRLASRFLGPEVTRVDLVETGTIPVMQNRATKRSETV
ncbi:MAG: glutamate racemase [Glaciihabitans sp.]|nr:glutamate racemase [Glaciihabitans sp.]